MLYVVYLLDNNTQSWGFLLSGKDVVQEPV